MASASTSKAANGSTAAPSPTLYVKNIESKIKKPELRRQLFSLFSTYGRVLDVVATRAPGMRGQAFVVFESAATSTAAKRGLSGFSFYGKQLSIDYSTGDKSKAILRRELGDEAVQEMDLEKSKTTVSRRGEKRSLPTNQHDDAQTQHDHDNNDNDEDQDQDGRSKRVKLEQAEEQAVVITAQDVPTEIEADVLHTLFSRQAGYLGVEPSIKQEKQQPDTWQAHIRFDTQPNAQAAKLALDAIQLDPTYRLNLVL